MSQNRKGEPFGSPILDLSISAVARAVRRLEVALEADAADEIVALRATVRGVDDSRADGAIVTLELAIGTFHTDQEAGNRAPRDLANDRERADRVVGTRRVERGVRSANEPEMVGV